MFFKWAQRQAFQQMVLERCHKNQGLLQILMSLRGLFCELRARACTLKRQRDYSSDLASTQPSCSPGNRERAWSFLPTLPVISSACTLSPRSPIVQAMLQASCCTCTPVPLGSHYGHQFQFACPALVWRADSCLPHDCRATLAQQTSAVLGHSVGST